MEHAEIPEGISALDAVADAIMVAYAGQLKRRNYDFYKYRPESDLDALLHKATSGWCYDSSVNMLYFLTGKYKKVFDTAFLLTSWDFDSKSLIRQKDQFIHTYAVIHGKDKFWYAASPSNHDSNKKKSYAFEMIRGNSLESILKEIQKRDGGYWPTSTEINEQLSGGKYHAPETDLDEHTLRAFDIQRKGQKVDGIMIEDRADVTIT